MGGTLGEMELELLASLGEVLCASQWQRMPSQVRRILEKLCQRIQELEQQSAGLEKELARLKEENEDLRENLESDSSNSSKPPSSDRGAKPRPRARRKPSGRKRGGQPGHPGQWRKLFPPEQCRKIEDHYPQQCENCGSHDLEDCGEEPYRHQVLEIPPLKLLIDEHRLHWQECLRCGQWVRAELPEGVSMAGYGPRLTALIVIFGSFFRASYRMTQALVGDLFGVRIALGTIRKLRQRVSEAVAAPVAEAKRYVQRSGVVHADETSYKQGNGDGENPANRGGWLWVVASPLVAYFEIQLSRAATVAQELLGDFTGVLVSDRYKGYIWVDSSRRQLCWAHLIRNFEKMAGRLGRSGEIGHELVEGAKRLFHEWHRVRDGTILFSTFQKYASQIRREIRILLEEGASYTPQAGEKSARAKTARSCEELLALEPAMWLFVRHGGIPECNLSTLQAGLEAFGKVDELAVHIHSPGGGTLEGLAMTNRLIDHPARVVTKIDGLAGSMAGVVAMAGDEVEIVENGFLVIHNPWARLQGEAVDLRREADLLDILKDHLIRAYQRHTSLDAAALSDLMDAETWLTAGEALELDFVTTVTGPVDVGARIDPSKYERIPEAARVFFLSPEIPPNPPFSKGGTRTSTPSPPPLRKEGAGGRISPAKNPHGGNEMSKEKDAPPEEPDAKKKTAPPSKPEEPKAEKPPAKTDDDKPGLLASLGRLSPGEERP